MAQWLVGRRCGRTLAKPHKAWRFFCYLIPALTTLAALLLSQRLWDGWWLSVVLGAVVGGFIGGVVVVFRRPVPRRKMVEPGRSGRRVDLRPSAIAPPTPHARRPPTVACPRYGVTSIAGDVGVRRGVGEA
jgi:hypothetical protein